MQKNDKKLVALSKVVQLIVELPDIDAKQSTYSKVKGPTGLSRYF